MENTNHFRLHNDLILFAAYFSKHYRLFSTGDYHSHDKKYTLKYYNNPVFNADKNHVWSVEHFTNTMRVSYDNLQSPELSSDFVFYMIIWSAALIHYKNELKITDFEKADIEAMAYYKTTGRSVQNILKGYIFLFKKWPTTTENNLRLKWILNVKGTIDVAKPKKELSYLINRENKTVILYPLHLKQRIYSKFLDGEILPEDITLNSFLSQIIKSMKDSYFPKQYKIYFEFKGKLTEIYW